MILRPTYQEYVQRVQWLSQRNAEDIGPSDMPVVRYLASHGFTRADAMAMPWEEREGLVAYLRIGVANV